MALEVFDVRVQRGTRIVLDAISLSIPSNSVVALIGRSGCGKTTLLKVVAGLLAPDAGHVAIATNLRVGLMFQDHLLQPWLTVRDTVSLPLRLRGESPDVDPLLVQLGLDEVATSYPWQISGGMQRRVSLARTLVSAPDILLLDEPFYGVDEITRLAAYQVVLDAIRDSVTSAVIVTHNISEAILLADEVVVLGGDPATVTTTVPIPLARPRDIRAMQTIAFGDLLRTVRSCFMERI